MSRFTRDATVAAAAAVGYLAGALWGFLRLDPAPTRPRCTCPDIDVTGPHHTRRQVVKGYDPDCPTCGLYPAVTG